MEHRKLGNTDIEVSALCLGTMTWGGQNTEAEAHAQIETALEAGINFIDNAEMYPTPVKAENWGRSEEILGSWLAGPGRRDKVIVTSKVIGPGRDYPWVRSGRTRLDRGSIEAALETSLKRLRTDYVDLYQLHWPDRKLARDGGSGFWNPPEADAVPLAETLEVLDGLVRAGKIRHVGLSNDTPWGVMALTHLAETKGWPRMVSIQNAYNLLDRQFEDALAEVAIRERCGLLAYSPLAAGALSGKYLGGKRPGGARLTTREGTPYRRPGAEAAILAYQQLAADHGIPVTRMAIAFAASRPFMTSVIVAATTPEHLAGNIAAVDSALPDSVLAGIERIHGEDPNPAA
jgi:aryl-alcohol dehydrogenase-like predicted oxidoreductase